MYMKKKEMNPLSQAIINMDELLVDQILEEQSIQELNEGPCPLYFLGNNGIKKEEDKQILLRIFRKVLSHPKFTNVNTIYLDSNYYTSTLLDEFIFNASIYDPIFETCAVELIQSPKYKLINFISNYQGCPTPLHKAIERKSIPIVQAILNHSDFRNINASNSHLMEIIKKCTSFHFSEEYLSLSSEEKEDLDLVLDKYMTKKNLEEDHLFPLRFRKESPTYFYNKESGKKGWYPADEPILSGQLEKAIFHVEKIFSSVEARIHFAPLDMATYHDTLDQQIFNTIIHHSKFNGSMLLNKIKTIATTLSNQEMYRYIHVKGLPRCKKGDYDQIIFYAADQKKLGLLQALLESPLVQMSEAFCSYYFYYLKNALSYSVFEDWKTLTASYTPIEAMEITQLFEEKIEKQKGRGFYDSTKEIHLQQVDYALLKCATGSYYSILEGNTNHFVYLLPSEFHEQLCGVSKHHKGPFFNQFATDNIRKYFLEYDTFSPFRNAIKKEIDASSPKKFIIQMPYK